MRMLAGWIWRDHRLDTALGEFVAQAPGVVSSVGQQSSRRPHRVDQTARADKIVRVARCDQERQGPTNIVGQRVDFGGSPAA